MSTWTDDRIKTLLKLWAGGLSVSQIAGRLGDVTRNSVIAKIHRLKHAKGDRAPVARVIGGPRPKQTRAPPPVAAKFGPPKSVPKPITRYVESQVRRFDPIKLVSMIDLENHHCRWPLNDPRSPEFRYCGETKALGLPYCVACASVAYTPPRIAARPAGVVAGGQTGKPGCLGGSGKIPAAGEAAALETEDA